jgi:hypothetical protein
MPAAIPFEGIDIALVIRQPMPSAGDFAALRVVLDESFEAVSDPTWDTLRGMMIREGWTAAHLQRTFEALLRTKTWVQPGDVRPRWTIGDWFRRTTPKVYSHQWYQEQVAPPKGVASNERLIGVYKLPGRSGPVWAWREEADGILEPWEPAAAPPLALPAPREERNPETEQMIADRLKVMRLETTIEDLNRELVSMQREVAKWKRRAQHAELQVRELEGAADENRQTMHDVMEGDWKP